MKKLLGRLSQKKPRPEPEEGEPEQGRASDLAEQASVSASSAANGADKPAEQPSSSSADAGADPLARTPFTRVRYLKNEGLGQALLVAKDKHDKLVVIKLIDRGPNVSPKVEQEVVNHNKCKGHPNITQLLDLFITPKHLAFVMEYAEGGDLRTHIDKAGKLSESETRCILQQIVRALRRYHEVGMAKRDLRLEHILLCDGAPGVPHIKLCDFAYSKTEQVNSDPKSALGSLVYTAPEEIMVQTHSDERSADVWSIGVLMYIMLTGTYPFGQLAAVYDQKQVQDMLSRIMEAKYEAPAQASAGAVALLQRLLIREAAQRATLDDVCKDEWLTQDLPARFWEDVPPIPDNSEAAEEERELRSMCQVGQRALVTTPSADIDQLADDLMDMEECEAAFDDLSL